MVTEACLRQKPYACGTTSEDNDFQKTSKCQNSTTPFVTPPSVSLRDWFVLTIILQSLLVTMYGGTQALK